MKKQMKWTDSQHKAIIATPAELIVSAAAGSGKTQVLSTRIIERIKNSENPVSVDKLLVVTFTKAAAAEMKERIGKVLRSEIKIESDELKKAHLTKQLSLLGGAQICTIDSFCYDIVRQNFYRANLPSDISIGDSGELTLLRLEALEETVDALYCALALKKGETLSEENLALSDIVTEFFTDENERSLILEGFDLLTQSCTSDKKDSDFFQSSRGGDYTTMIAELHLKSQAAAFPEKWLSALYDEYDPEKKTYTETTFCKRAFDDASKIIKDGIATLSHCAEVSEASSIGYEETLRSDVEQLIELSKAQSYEELHEKFSTASLFPTLKGKKRNCDAAIAEGIKGSRDKFKSLIKDTAAKLVEFSVSECELIRKELFLQIKALCCAVKLLDKIYFEKMLKRHLLDFAACEHIALNIISSDGKVLTETGEVLKNKYDEIYIDEFQDSNELQNTLFSLISKERLFTVGDVKQSIYGFRNSDPTIFMEKCRVSSFDLTAKKRKIFLSHNFRSRKCIIDSVNSVFDVIMTDEVCSIDYKGEHRLEFGAEFIPEREKEVKSEIAVIQKSKTAEECIYNEALLTAKKINELIDTKVCIWDKDEEKMRPVKYSDITILMRTTKAAPVFKKVLSEHSIPCFFDGGEEIYSTGEVSQIIEILKLIDNSACDVPLACTLRSPMFLFDENDLLKIKLSGGKTFYEAFFGICNGKYKVDEELFSKCVSFSKLLAKWKAIAGFISIEELIRRIYTDTGLYSIALSFPDGQLRRANLDLLLENARQFEKSSYSGLFNFINYIEKVKKTRGSGREAKTMSERMNVVRIMTIHKSKGLEFPIVILACCGEPFRNSFSSVCGMTIDSKIGIGINVINPTLRCRYSSPMNNTLSEAMRCENVSEELRLLYVALTRARERLITICTEKDLISFENMQCSHLPSLSRSDILSAKSYCALIALALGHGADKYWNVTYHLPQEKTLLPADNDNAENDFIYDEAISNLLSYKYPYSYATALPNKASVSYLKSVDVNLSSDEEDFMHAFNDASCQRIKLQKPDFGEKSHSGAFYGTAHHKVLQHISFDDTPLSLLINSLYEKGILDSDEVKIIDEEKIKSFLSSSLAEKMRVASVIHREEPFVISIGADELGGEFPSDEKIYVQGIIDCYLEMPDGSIILIDYKTDTYSNPLQIVEKYKKQLFYYEKALKLKYKNKFIQKYLYLLHKNDIIEV